MRALPAQGRAELVAWVVAMLVAGRLLVGVLMAGIVETAVSVATTRKAQVAETAWSSQAVAETEPLSREAARQEVFVVMAVAAQVDEVKAEEVSKVVEKTAAAA